MLVGIESRKKDKGKTWRVCPGLPSHAPPRRTFVFILNCLPSNFSLICYSKTARGWMRSLSRLPEALPYFWIQWTFSAACGLSKHLTQWLISLPWTPPASVRTHSQAALLDVTPRVQNLFLPVRFLRWSDTDICLFAKNTLVCSYSPDTSPEFLTCCTQYLHMNI